MKRALVTGITGQDGSYLAELLLEKGYEVYGVARRSPAEYENLRALRSRVDVIQADVLDQLSLVRALERCRPHEVYNLAPYFALNLAWLRLRAGQWDEAERAERRFPSRIKRRPLPLLAPKNIVWPALRRRLARGPKPRQPVGARPGSPGRGNPTGPSFRRCPGTTANGCLR